MNNKRVLALLLIAAISLVSFLGCKSEQAQVESETTEEAEVEAGPEKITGGAPWINSDIKENISESTKTNPKNDFHLYANKDWLNGNDIPDGYTSYNHYKECQDVTDERARALLVDDTLDSDLAIQLQAFYNQVLDWDARNEIGMEPLKTDVEYFEGLESLDDVFRLMTDTTEGYSDVLFSYGVWADPENSTRNILHLSQMEYILDDAAEYSDRTENGELTYNICKDVFQYMMGRMDYSAEDADKIFEQCIEFESKLAESSYTYEDYYSVEYDQESVNKMALEDVLNLCENYPMAEVMKSLNCDVSIINVEKPEYFITLDSIMTEDNLEGIKAYYIVNTVLGSRKLLDEECYRKTTEIVNNYYGVSGTIPDDQMAYSIVGRMYNIKLQQLYVEQYGSQEQKDLVTDICKDVIATYEEMLLENDYLSKETIDYAVEKLRSIALNVAYPDKWPEMEDYTLDGMTLYEADGYSSNYITKANLAKAGKAVDKEMWIDVDSDMSVMECNAFYNPTDNSINMILGMMGEPFFYEDMLVEELYASLGAFWIGHEVSHAFDSSGSQYDKDGNLRDWWTSEDADAYAERIAKVDAYLDTLCPFEGYMVNGSMVDTEMVADMTGLQCALKMAAKIDNFDYDKFFTKYAQMNASIELPSAELSQLLTDSHPLNYLRTNVPVQQFEEFYTTYDVKEGDGMYLATENRILVW